MSGHKVRHAGWRLMNSANLKNSARLRRTLKALEDQRDHGLDGWISTRSLIWAAGICAVSSVIAELRDNGCKIETRQATVSGEARRWEYRLIEAPEGWRRET